MIEYRRAGDGKIWHCCRNCVAWPRESFNIIRLEKFPKDFHLCQKCIELRTIGKCRDTGLRRSGHYHPSQ